MTDRSRIRLPPSALLLLAMLLLALPVAGAAQAPGRAHVLAVEGAIGPATADYVTGGIDRAADEGATLVVLRIDTPGGLDSSMREIIQAILRSRLPVVGYVHPSGARAASAGTFILYASHIAAMTPATNVGAATPVQIGGATPAAPQGDDGSGNTQQRAPQSASDVKAVNDAVAYIRSLAQLRGRNADWAERAVRAGDSLSAEDALEQGVVDLVAADLSQLMARIDGRRVAIEGADIVLRTRGAELVRIEPGFRTRLLAAITNPNVALILLMLGVYGLFFEFMNPGALYPGTIGAIALLLALYSLAALPVNVAGIGLLLLGIALMAAEAFSPSFGVLGLAGIVAFMLGGTILIDTDLPQFQIHWPTVAAIGVAAALLFGVTGRLAYSAHRRGVVSGAEEMVGATGVVQDWRDGTGHVFVHSERWRAIGPAMLTAGTPVRVVAIDQLVLTVEAAEADETQ